MILLDEACNEYIIYLLLFYFHCNSQTIKHAATSEGA